MRKSTKNELAVLSMIIFHIVIFFGTAKLLTIGDEAKYERKANERY